MPNPSLVDPPVLLSYIVQYQRFAVGPNGNILHMATEDRHLS